MGIGGDLRGHFRMGSLDVESGAVVDDSTGHQPTQSMLSILFCLSFALGLGSREEESYKSISKKEGSRHFWKRELMEKQREEGPAGGSWLT